MNMSSMRTNSTVIEPEILDENGRPLASAEPERQEPIHIYHRAGFFAGFVALMFSVVMMLVMALVTVFIVAPILLLGRLSGMQIKTFRR